MGLGVRTHFSLPPFQWFITPDAQKFGELTMAATPTITALRVTVQRTGESFELAVYAGMEPAALSQAVASRAGCSGASEFYMTAGKAAVLPLSASLPDGMELTLHHVADIGAPPAPPLQVGPSETTPNDSEAGGSVPLLARRPVVAPSADPAAIGMPKRQESACTAVEKQLDGLERLNRVSTDLANERTLLAWVRTGMAAIRTLFTYLALTGTTPGWHASVLATEIAMAALVLITAGTGVWRYFRLKAILGQKVPPRDFGRRTLRPFAVLVLATAMASAVGVSSQQWEKK